MAQGEFNMADEAITETVEETVIEPVVETVEETKVDEIDWKAMSRKHEAEAKANRTAAAELEKIKAKGRTAEEKVTKERDDAARERDEARAEAAIERAARKHGLTDDKDLEVLEGLPADKVEAVAAALAASKTKSPGKSGTEVTGKKTERKPTSLASAVHAAYQK